MPEWLIGAVSKTVKPSDGFPGFESRSLRFFTYPPNIYFEACPPSLLVERGDTLAIGDRGGSYWIFKFFRMLSTAFSMSARWPKALNLT